jgi:hypothetical protein
VTRVLPRAGWGGAEGGGSARESPATARAGAVGAGGRDEEAWGTGSDIAWTSDDMAAAM